MLESTFREAAHFASLRGIRSGYSGVSWVTSCLKIGRITDQLLTQISDLMSSWESVEEVVGQVRALNAATEMVLEDT